ncbi:ABC transporter permease [Nocardiopsis potens]|uniref:ABC transporter permease n=1 Tax=Nocardiopsis potens TaxID=1246458 RepID=UPI000346738F|nr:ABC transporter permease [Nocardiopsis potens]
MAAPVRAFGRNDLIGLRRDSMLRFLVVAPFLYLAVLRFTLPPLTEMLDQRYGFDLVPYHPLIVSMFLVLGTPGVLGALAGLMLLEEKDSGTLQALRVAPVSMSVFALYRVATLVVVTTLFITVAVALSGFMPEGAAGPAGTAAAALSAGLTAAVVAVLMALVARNKLEGLAVVRAVGTVLFALPLLPWFIPGAWGLAFGVLPSYWAAKIFWVAAEGGAVWPWLLGGAAVNGAYLALLLWGFDRRNR